MSKRLERALKGLILIGLALFLTNSIINGSLLFYISRRFAWLTWVATILLLFIAFAYQRTLHVRDHQEHDKGQEHHDHLPGGGSAWMALVLVALPLVLGILVPPRPLGAQAVGVREVNTDGVGLGDDEALLTRAASERNILDWLRAFSATDDPSVLSGQTARVIGFVYRDDTFAADQFMVSRFVVSCCVADATVLGLIVSWPESADLPLDTWVEVQGAFQPGQIDGQTRPILVADSVTPTTPPNQPYLYP
jgi:putative membrane protein